MNWLSVAIAGLGGGFISYALYPVIGWYALIGSALWGYVTSLAFKR